MAQTTILRPRATKGPQLRESDGSSFVFDALISEAPSDEGEITRHPVEDGGVVSDHYQKQPVKLTMTVGLTNSPLPEQGTQETNRDFVLYEALLRIADKGEPITVVTGLRVYTNMVVLRTSTTRDPQTGQALVVQLDLEEVRLTTTATVDIPPERQRRRGGRQNPEAVANAAAATQQQVVAAAVAGTATEPEAKKTEEKNTSALATIF